MISAPHGDRRQQLVAGLEEEAQAIEAQIDELQGQIQELKREHTGIRNAIAALTGVKPPVRVRGRARRKVAKGKRQGPTVSDVSEMIAQLLGEERELSGEELRERIAEKAAAEGRSRQGLHFVVTKALRGDRFEEESGKYRLVGR